MVTLSLSLLSVSFLVRVDRGGALFFWGAVTGIPQHWRVSRARLQLCEPLHGGMLEDPASAL